MRFQIGAHGSASNPWWDLPPHRFCDAPRLR
jgi:hypothetical protein